MLLSNRRRRLIFICLAGMEMTWLTPLLLLLLQAQRRWFAGQPLPDPAPAALLLTLWGALLALMLALDLIQRRDLESPQFELTILGLLLVTTLLGIRFGLYSRAPLTDFRWLANTLTAIFEFQRGLRPELIFFLVSIYLWQRAASASSREISFFGVGVAFRFGVLLLIIGGSALAAGLTQPWQAVPFIWVYFALGLTTVALTRIEEQAGRGADSAGRMLPVGRLAQLVGMIGIVIGVTALLAGAITPRSLLRFIQVTGPFWLLLGRALQIALDLVFRLITPLLEWLLNVLTDLFRNSELLTSLDAMLQNMQPAAPPDGLALQPTPDPIPPWVWVGARYAFALVVLTCLILGVLLVLRRMRRPLGIEQEEEVAGEAVTFGGSSLRRAWRRLRSAARLVQRFGLTSQLLAAISVQNLYANASRLARRRGFGRPAATAPDQYLPLLAQAFPGQEPALQRLTQAYMRVHYGDHPVSEQELGQLRADFRAIQEAPQPEKHKPGQP